jgi:hypothetical protein
MGWELNLPRLQQCNQKRGWGEKWQVELEGAEKRQMNGIRGLGEEREEEVADTLLQTVSNECGMIAGMNR